MDRLSRERARQINEERAQDAPAEERPPAENASGEHAAPGVYVEETSFAAAPLQGAGNQLDVMADAGGELDPGPSASGGDEPLGYTDSFGQIGVHREGAEPTTDGRQSLIEAMGAGQADIGMATSAESDEPEQGGANESGVGLHGVGIVDGLESAPSSYIGETEKNLADQLERAGQPEPTTAFDEADALFGKRTEVRDAHDRYANQEVNSQAGTEAGGNAAYLDVWERPVTPDQAGGSAGLLDAARTDAESAEAISSPREEIQTGFVEVPADAAQISTAAGNAGGLNFNPEAGDEAPAPREALESSGEAPGSVDTQLWTARQSGTVLEASSDAQVWKAPAGVEATVAGDLDANTPGEPTKLVEALGSEIIVNNEFVETPADRAEAASAAHDAASLRGDEVFPLQGTEPVESAFRPEIGDEVVVPQAQASGTLAGNDNEWRLTQEQPANLDSRPSVEGSSPAGDDQASFYQERIANEGFVQEPAGFTYQKIEWAAVGQEAPDPEANMMDETPRVHEEQGIQNVMVGMGQKDAVVGDTGQPGTAELGEDEILPYLHDVPTDVPQPQELGVAQADDDDDDPLDGI